MDRFLGAKLKVQRAQEHIQNLGRMLEAFQDTDFYSVSINENPKTGHKALSVRITKALPEIAPLVIGDAIHNLRAALDLLAYETVSAITGEEAPKVYFPFSSKRENLKDAKGYGAIQAASPEVARFITDTIQPYETGNRALWGLNKLDILDKHRLLIPTGQVTQISVTRFTDEGKDATETVIFGHDGLGGMDVFHTAGNLNIKSYRKPLVTIFFGPETPFNGQDICQVLIMRVIDIQRIIQAFTKAGYGRKS